MSLHQCHKGNPNHPLCVFLHGFLGAKEDWKEMWDIFSQNYFCLAFDLPGHNTSAAISSDYLEILQAAILQAACIRPLQKPAFKEKCDDFSYESTHSIDIGDSQEVKSFEKARIFPKMGFRKRSILIGYSMGGRIALQLAHKNPFLYSHVILLSAHPGITDEAQRALRWQQDLYWIEKLKHLNLETFLIEWYNQSLFRSLHKRPHLLHSILKKRSCQDPQKMADVMQMLSLGRQPVIPSFHPRTLFLYGEDDERYQMIYTTLPASVSLRKVEQSGHMIHLENPILCAARILQWMEENA